MRFKKIDENEHGPIVNVINEGGFVVGTISKWHGLFIAKDWEGSELSRPFRARKRAAEHLVEDFDFKARGGR